MKKKSKKEVKAPARRSRTATAEPELPTLVNVMAKFVERLEGLEQKMALVLGHVSNLPSGGRNTVQQIQHPTIPHQGQSSPQAPVPARQEHGPNHPHSDKRRERPLYQAICADCRKSCEIPFKPAAERPVYCKECFAIRKSGHKPQNPDRRVEIPQQQPPHKKSGRFPSPLNFKPRVVVHSANTAAAHGNQTQKPGRGDGARAKKKKYVH